MVNDSQQPSTSSQLSTNAFSFLSKGWREVRDSADADLQLMRDRANSFKNLASSFDREIENFINNSARSAFSVNSPSPSFSGEIDFVKRLQPKISEFRRVYSAPEISRKVLEKWGPARTSLGIDLSAIRKAIVAEVDVDEEDRNAIVEFERVRKGRRRRRGRMEREGVEGHFGDWGEPIRALKTRLRELEKRSSSEIFSINGFKSNEFVEKIKSSWKAFYKEAQESKEVPPLDVPELLACLVRQSEPFLDQLGVRKGKHFCIFFPTDADIAILEEPEHLNWYHHGKRWTDKFNHVVGIVHTNYLEYIKREKNGAFQAFLVKHINNWVTRAYCHKVLRLSAATQDLPKSVICNVHGVNPKFLKIGEKIAADRELGQQAFSKGAYFLGKMVWAKGYRELIDLLSKHKSDLDGFKLDVFGNGEDAHEVQSMARKLDLNLNFLKGRDHADDSLHGYKVFINPSVSDVLCTATAEALAMGKFVVCADHPSNEFFRSFPNCLTYKTSEDFVAKVKEALASEPQPLTPEQRYNLSWEAATQRFMEYSDLDKILNDEKNNANFNESGGKMVRKSICMPSLTEMVDGGLAFGHHCLTGNEFLRLCTGAIPGTRDYDKQHCKDLHLLPPQVENPIYGW
ncbi:digalactosyldiacylglycerol synthase 1, chloroplastic [Carica papaya]|uniref:digalactosyldiacylglycerol synthase 1, chloroplastic n=1 Tax=Carica papaya TaxID=3649 RepID=UPI000B8CFE8A|nr:digalactosyldiacylglycerol synthase 1, chloroplastic [Carica papaya]